MGQILRRISKIAKSYMNDVVVSQPAKIKDDDEDLKRIIEELNKTKQKQKSPDKNKSRTNRDGEITLDMAYIILDTDRNSSIEQLKSAYRKIIIEYHPDKVASLGKELKELAEQKTQEINKAYQVIRKNRGF